MEQVVVSGVASGIGAATRRRLQKSGARVIGIDLRDAEVIADLSTPQGRAAAIEAVRAQSRGRIDGLVVCAGLGPQFEPRSTIASVNYFGAQSLLSGLRDLLVAAAPAAAVAVVSVSAVLPGANAD